MNNENGTIRDDAFLLACFAKALSFEQIPSDVIDRLKLLYADYIAACFAGLRINREANRVVRELASKAGGCCQSSVFGHDGRLPAEQAAFLNAFVSHGADIDDGNKRAAGHIGTHIFSSVLAVAEREGSTWGEVAEAVLVGYEVFDRVAAAAQPALYNRGFHSTGVAGGFSSAAACAKLQDLELRSIYDAIGIGAVQSSGLIIIDESAQETKPLNAASAARLGVISSDLAKMGLRGPELPLNHPKKGWLSAFAGHYDSAEISGGLGTRYTIMDCYLKMYPTCRHTHGLIDVAIALRETIIKEHGGIEIERLSSIELRVYPKAMRSAGVIRQPANEHEAKFSICYTFAVSFVKGGFSLEDLNPTAVPEDVWRVVDLVRLAVDGSLEDRSAGIRGAQAFVGYETDVYESTVLVPKGEGDEPLAWEDMRKKMSMCVGSLHSKDKVDELVERCRCLDFEKPYVPFIEWL